MSVLSVGSFEVWCWRKMEKISATNRVKNEEGLQRVKKERKANWVGHVLLTNCLLKHVIEGKLE